MYENQPTRPQVGHDNPEAWNLSFSLRELNAYLALDKRRPKTEAYFKNLAVEMEIEGKGRSLFLNLHRKLTSEALLLPPVVIVKYFPWLRYK